MNIVGTSIKGRGCPCEKKTGIGAIAGSVRGWLQKKLRGSVYSHGASVGPRVSGVRRAKRARADWRSAR